MEEKKVTKEETKKKFPTWSKYAIAGILGTSAALKLAQMKLTQPESAKYNPSEKTALDPNYSPIKELQSKDKQ